MFKEERSNIGVLGEDMACKFLKGKGFTVIERNYSVPYGEIDIIVYDDNGLRFVEVKAVSCETDYFELKHRPEEKVDKNKYLKIAKVAETYLHQNVYTKQDPESVIWQIDVVAIVFVNKTKKAKITFLEDVNYDRKR